MYDSDKLDNDLLKKHGGEMIAPHRHNRTTPQAINFVSSVEGIVLIDGRRLAGLMIDYELGVTSRTIKIPKIDSDYFDEESN